MRRQFYSAKDLAERYGKHHATIWRWVKNGELPKPVKLSPGTTAWAAAEIEQHDAERLANRDSAA